MWHWSLCVPGSSWSHTSEVTLKSHLHLLVVKKKVLKLIKMSTRHVWCIAIFKVSGHICDILFAVIERCTPLVYLQKSVLGKQFYHWYRGHLATKTSLISLQCSRCIELSDACKQDKNIMCLCVCDFACKDHRNLPKNEIEEDENDEVSRSTS